MHVLVVLNEVAEQFLINSMTLTLNMIILPMIAVVALEGLDLKVDPHVAVVLIEVAEHFFINPMTLTL